MKYQIRAITLYLGRLNRSTVVWGLAAIICITQLFFLSNASNDQLPNSAWSNATFDLMIKNRLWSHAKDPRIIVIDIDEASLLVMSKEFGRWPWPRDTLATVLGFLENQSVSSITWDILFSDLDRLSPGGDKAFDLAVSQSKHSVFPLVRLPKQYDATSLVTRVVLPKLWLSPSAPSSVPSAVAMIPPVLPAISAARLGYNNGFPDKDGVIRRYSWSLELTDQSSIQSIALATVQMLKGDNYKWRELKPLMHWRAELNSYPRLPFHEVFSAAEGNAEARAALSSKLKNAIVIVGSTASSLHDVHTSPLGRQHAGVDILATAIDNGINRHQLSELPAWLSTSIAILLCFALAAWIEIRDTGVLHGGLVILPTFILLVGFISLHGLPIFLDLSAAATSVLLYVAVLKTWFAWNKDYWCQHNTTAQALMIVQCKDTNLSFDGVLIDQLIRVLAMHAPSVRLIGGDVSATWPASLRWPETVNLIGLTGDVSQLKSLRALFAEKLEINCGALTALETPSTKIEQAKLVAKLSAQFI